MGAPSVRRLAEGCAAAPLRQLQFYRGGAIAVGLARWAEPSSWQASSDSMELGTARDVRRGHLLDTRGCIAETGQESSQVLTAAQ